jgi:transposase
VASGTTDQRPARAIKKLAEETLEIRRWYVSLGEELFAPRSRWICQIPWMRGAHIIQNSLLTAPKLDIFVPTDSPVRLMHPLIDAAFKRLGGWFGTIYRDCGRALIAPAKLLRAHLLQPFHSVRRRRLLLEQLGYNLLSRWFVDLAIDDAVWDHSVFSKNRDRLDHNKLIHRWRSCAISSNKDGANGRSIEAWERANFLTVCRERRRMPHVAQSKTNPRGVIEGRTTRHGG